jgi:hypothetical protein
MLPVSARTTDAEMTRQSRDTWVPDTGQLGVCVGVTGRAMAHRPDHPPLSVIVNETSLAPRSCQEASSCRSEQERNWRETWGGALWIRAAEPGADVTFTMQGTGAQGGEQGRAGGEQADHNEDRHSENLSLGCLFLSSH